MIPALSLVLALLLPPQGPAASGPVRAGSVVGELVDLGCRLFPRTGVAHSCAESCLTEGSFPAILDEESGRAYLVFDAAGRPGGERMKPLAGSRVRATGRVREAKGVRVILVDGFGRADGSPPAGAPAAAAAEKPRDANFVATVVSVLDQVEAAAKSQKHSCNARCCGPGASLGLLDVETGRLHLALAPERKSARGLLEPLAGARVRVTGRISGNAVEILKVEKG